MSVSRIEDYEAVHATIRAKRYGSRAQARARRVIIILHMLRCSAFAHLISLFAAQHAPPPSLSSLLSIPPLRLSHHCSAFPLSVPLITAQLSPSPSLSSLLTIPPLRPPHHSSHLPLSVPIITPPHSSPAFPAPLSPSSLSPLPLPLSPSHSFLLPTLTT